MRIDDPSSFELGDENPEGAAFEQGALHDGGDLIIELSAGSVGGADKLPAENGQETDRKPAGWFHEAKG
jgi:hypothetical protein